MKKILFAFVILSMLLSACGGPEAILPPGPAGVDMVTDPGYAGESSNQLVQTVDLSAVWAEAGINPPGIPVEQVVDQVQGMVAQAFKRPGSIQGALMVLPMAGMVAVSDTLALGPMDVVAVVMVAGVAYFVCVLTAEAAAQAAGQFVELTAEQFKVLWATLTASVAVEAIDLMLMARHTDRSHNPNFKGTDARKNIGLFLAAVATLAAITTPGGPGDYRCGAIKDAAGLIVRFSIWVADAARAAGGYVIVINPNNPGAPYVGSYDLGQNDWEGGPNQSQLNSANRTWSNNVPCPGSWPGLQPVMAK